MKIVFFTTFYIVTQLFAQNGEVAVVPNDTTKDPGLQVGDIAPSWALMAGPGKFEFLKNWTEIKGKKLRKPITQPDRHVLVLSFFATWCKPCMKELPHLENLYQKYKDEKIKFFLIDITEATRTVKGLEEMPKAGPFLKKKKALPCPFYMIHVVLPKNVMAPKHCPDFLWWTNTVSSS